jgi:putative hemolysin
LILLLKVFYQKHSPLYIMEILVILLLIFMNGFLSMSEIALVSSRKSRLEIDAKKGNLAAKRILKMSEKPERFLSTIQIGITLIGILTGLYSGEALSGDFARFLSKWPLLEPIASGLSKTIIVIVVTYVTLIFGELLPKRIGMSAAEKTSKIVVGLSDLSKAIILSGMLGGRNRGGSWGGGSSSGGFGGFGGGRFGGGGAKGGW